MVEIKGRIKRSRKGWSVKKQRIPADIQHNNYYLEAITSSKINASSPQFQLSHPVLGVFYAAMEVDLNAMEILIIW